MAPLLDPPTFAEYILKTSRAAMKIVRNIGYVLIALGLFARIFIAGMTDNGAILSVIGGLVVLATVVAASSGNRSSNR